jgi:hypothetical protein
MRKEGDGKSFSQEEADSKREKGRLRSQCWEAPPSSPFTRGGFLLVSTSAYRELERSRGAGLKRRAVILWQRNPSCGPG